MMRYLFFFSLIFFFYHVSAQTRAFAKLQPSPANITKAVSNADIPPSEAGRDTALCRGEQVQVGTTTDPAYNYSWSPATGLSDTTISNPFVSGINDDSVILYKKYYVTTSLKSDHSSQSTDSVIVAINPKPIVTRDTTVCKGSTITLKANRGVTYQWVPATGLSGATVQNPVCTVNASQTYYLTETNLANNLVLNGDFEQGDTGFSSSYVSCNTNNCLVNYSSDGYSVGTNPKFFQSNFIGRDHTTGNGNFMIINGAVQGLTVWKQTVNVIPGKDYSLACWVSTMVKFNFAQLRFSINGVQLDSIFKAPTDTSVWKQFYSNWNSGTNTTATIEIVDILNQSDGNDFGLDDIFFGPISSCTDSVHIQTFSSAIVNSAATICSGKADTLPSGKIVFNPGPYADTLKNSHGCDSLITNLSLTVISPQVNNVASFVCSGQPFTLPSGKVINVAGIYNDTIRSYSGCDSLITNDTLHVLTPKYTDTAVSICFGNFYILPSNNKINLPGNYLDTVKSNKGCDSLITTVHLTVISSTSETKDVTICKGNFYTLPSGKIVIAANTYLDTLKNNAGCDSLITTVNLTVFSPTLISINVTICNGETYTMPSGIILNTTGIYKDTLKNIAGCDSLITTVNLMVNSPVILPINNITICPGQTYTLPSGKKVNTTGVYKDTLQNLSGCDSLITTVGLTVLFPIAVTKDVSICQGQSYTLPSGIFFNTTGTHKDTLKSAQGCDSLFTTVNLKVISPTFAITNASICSGIYYTLPSGTQVRTAGTYQDTLKNTVGCDSLITKTNLVVTFNFVSVNKSVLICIGQSYVMPSGTILKATGVYEDTLKSINGCDSLITTINLTVVSPTLVTKDVSICSGQSYTMPSGIIINTTGFYKDTLKSSAGCDSLITSVNLTVNVPTSSASNVSICTGQPYTLPSGLTVNTPGVYQSIIKNVKGCDSTITTTIVNKPPLSINLSAPAFICGGDPASILAQTSGGNDGPYTYTWSVSGITTNQLIFFPTTDTKVIVTVNDGCMPPAKDSITILVKPRPTAGFAVTNAEGCVPLSVEFTNSSSPLSGNSYTWDFGDFSNSSQVSPNHIYTTPGNYDVILIAANLNGCSDSFKIRNAAKAITPPVAAFTTSPFPNIFDNAKIDFIDKSTGASSWMWIFGDGMGSSVQRDPIYVYQDSGTYKTRLIVTNNSNCADTAYASINIKGGGEIYIPNAFTPNGDNLNDNFRIYGIGLKSVNMAIFDRWGEKVFQKTGIVPLWDGKDQKSGIDCLQGVFIYVISVTDKTGKVQSFRGTVTLLR